MQKSSFAKSVLAAALVALGLTSVACGGKLERPYSNAGGGVVLELRSGSKAELTLNGLSQDCAWKSAERKVKITCGGDSLDFGLHDDGSLTEPSFVGVMRKSEG